MSQCTTNTSNIPKTNINGSISTSNFTASDTNSVIKSVTLTELQNAIAKLNEYSAKVNNCGNCKQFNLTSTVCQKVVYYTTTGTVTQTTTQTVQCNCYSQTYCDAGF